MATQTTQGMVKAAEAAGKLGISPRTVKRAITRGSIPGTRVGTVYLVNAAWLAHVTTWRPQEEAVA